MAPPLHSLALDPTAADISEGEGWIPLSPSAREALGWVGARVRLTVQGEELAEILTELRDMDCAHTWRKLLPSHGRIGVGEVVNIFDYERTHRPTAFFSYYGVEASGREELFGVATVADKICCSYESDGIPVLARSYIRLKHRGNDLYKLMFRHRIELCLRRWSSGLRAIHFGTLDPRVLRTSREHWTGLFPFFHMGDESLQLPEGARRVPAYLAFTPNFVNALRTEATGLTLADDARVRALTSSIEGLLRSGLGPNGYGALLKQLLECEQVLGWSLREKPQWGVLLSFLDAIPVIR